MTQEKNGYKKFLMFLIGNLILIFGITLVLVWWKDVILLFKGSIGMILALAGLLMLYIMGQK
ncbi:MAG: hypothetical protein P9X22_03130 [Candidatus Zapsychrus exili]|nr:hypothetical protein [Candidatus Zapsychrus exili]